MCDDCENDFCRMRCVLGLGLARSHANFFWTWPCELDLIEPEEAQPVSDRTLAKPAKKCRSRLCAGSGSTHRSSSSNLSFLATTGEHSPSVVVLIQQLGSSVCSFEEAFHLAKPCKSFRLPTRSAKRCEAVGRPRLAAGTERKGRQGR